MTDIIGIMSVDAQRVVADRTSSDTIFIFKLFLRLTYITPSIGGYYHGFLWNAITNPCLKFNDS